MYLFTRSKGWERIQNKFVAEEVADELFHFGFYKSEIKFEIENDDFFNLTVYDNHKHILEEEFFIQLCFFEQSYEILLPELPDLIVCLKELKESLVWK